MSNEEAMLVIQAIPGKIWEQLSENEHEAMEMAFKALKKQDSMLELPIAEGSTVYVVDYTLECRHRYICVLDFDLYKCEADIDCEHEYRKYRVRETKFNHMMLEKIGKTVFLTIEEAERRKDELNSQNEDL